MLSVCLCECVYVQELLGSVGPYYEAGEAHSTSAFSLYLDCFYWLWKFSPVYDTQTWEAGNKISAEGEGKREGSPVSTQEPIWGWFMHFAFYAATACWNICKFSSENHCMESTAIAISVIALEEETVPGAVFE